MLVCQPPLQLGTRTTPAFRTCVSHSPNNLTVEVTGPQMTCLTSPEVLEGPYYVNNELVRQDIRETQK